MSRCTPKSQEFIYAVEKAINRFSAVRDCKVYYDADKWNKRDYAADITIYHNSGWNADDTRYLKECMRDAGATNIIGGLKHAMTRDYLDLAFDIKQSKIKELSINKEGIG